MAPGSSSLRITSAGTVIRVIAAATAADLAGRCANQSEYEEDDANVAVFAPWPDPVLSQAGSGSHFPTDFLDCSGTPCGADPGRTTGRQSDVRGVHMATWKDSVRLATSEDIPNFPTVTVIDAVPVGAQDRILVKDQDNGVDNGIYEVIGASGRFRLRRAPDMRDGLDASDTSQTTVRVSEGANNAFTQWSLRVSGVVRVGTTSLPWARDYQNYSVESLVALTHLLAAPLGSAASVAGYATPGDNGGGDFTFVGVPKTSKIAKAAAMSIRIVSATLRPRGVIFTTEGDHGFRSGQSVYLSDVGAVPEARIVVLPRDDPSGTFLVEGLTTVALRENPRASCVMLTTEENHARGPGSQRLAVSGLVGSATGTSTRPPEVNQTWDVGSVFDATTLTLPVELPAPLPGGWSYAPGPAAVVGDGALLVPATDREGKRGGLWRRNITTPFHVAWWGALGDPNAAADDGPAINAAINSAKRFQDYDTSKRRQAGSTVRLGPGVYRCSSTKILVDGPVSLEGAGPGLGGATMLIFPIDFGDGDALVDVVETSADGSGTSGHGARICQLQVAQDPVNFPDPIESKSRVRTVGIRVQASDVVLEDIFVHHIQGHGIFIQGDGQGVNANVWCLKGAVTVQQCMGSGVLVQGNDANAGSQSGILSVKECLEWGLHEHSNLGNSWSAIHTEGNGLRAFNDAGSPVWKWLGKPVPPECVWSKETPITPGQLILPTFPANPAIDPTLDHRTGYTYRATTVTGEGKTGQAEPKWPTPQDPKPLDGATVRDGDVTWTRWSYEGGALYHEGGANLSTYQYIYVEAGQQPCRFDPGGGSHGTATVNQVFEMHPLSGVIAANVAQYSVPFAVRSRRSEPWDENPLLGQIRYPVVVGMGEHLGQGLGEKPRPTEADWAVASFKRADADNDWGHNAPGTTAPDVREHWRHDVGVLKDRWDGAYDRQTLGGLHAPEPSLRWRVEWDVEAKGREAHPLPFHSYSQVGGRSLPQPAAMCFPSLWLGNKTGVERRLGAVAAREDGSPDLTDLDTSGGNAFEQGDILFNAPKVGRPNWPAAWRASRRNAVKTQPQTAWNLRLYFYAGYVFRDDRGGLWRAANSGFSADGLDVPTTRPRFEVNATPGVVLHDGDVSWEFWGSEGDPTAWEPLITQAPTLVDVDVSAGGTIALTAEEWAHARLRFTGSPTSDVDVMVKPSPDEFWTKTFVNATASERGVRVRATDAGSGVWIHPGAGASLLSAVPHVQSLSSLNVRGTPSVSVDTHIGAATTLDDVPVLITFFDLADTEVRRIDVVVTVTNDTRQIRGTWSLAALAARVGATARLDGGDEDRNAIATDDRLAARLRAVGTRVQLECTGLAGTHLTWGWEVRGQQQASLT